MPNDILAKEHFILFNGDMVRAILDGRKTQTRRVVKPQPLHHMYAHDGAFRHAYGDKIVHCPFGVPGDRLWVRETFVDLRGKGFDVDCGYMASCPPGSAGDAQRIEYGLKCTPSIHMPRWASRIDLEITAVRVERLQAISEADCIAEGCPPEYALGQNWFKGLWDSINGRTPQSWDANPWVWVIEFRRSGA